MIKQILTWDLGATKCAAGLVIYDDATGNFHGERTCTIMLSTVQSLEELAHRIEHQLGIHHHQVDSICIGAAGVFDGSVIHLENGYPFSMPMAKVAATNHWAPFAVVHDYTSILCSTFCAGLVTRKLREGMPDPFGRRVAFGIGTGLGLKDGVQKPKGDFWLGTNEMGHIGLCCTQNVPAPMRPLHEELFRRGVSFEAVLSGKGMLKLHHFLYGEELSRPEELGRLLHAGKADRTLRAFSFYVGLFCATVQLTFMPSGGIFMAGGVLLKHQDLFSCEEFFLGLHALPAYKNERERFAMHIITDKHAALLGAAYYAAKRIHENRTN